MPEIRLVEPSVSGLAFSATPHALGSGARSASGGVSRSPSVLHATRDPREIRPNGGGTSEVQALRRWLAAALRSDAGMASTLSATLGLPFWFLTGYPFANHTESFLWVTRLDHRTFWEALVSPLGPVANPRPFGVGTAWL